MKNKNVLKLLLSLSLGLIFILLMNIKTTGLLFHEIFGIIIFVGIILHNIFNWKWTKGISKNIFKNNLKPKAKVMYILVLLLFLSISIILLTGILMSKYILTSISSQNILLIKFLHKYTSYFAIGVISIHFLLHTKYILVSFKNIFTNIRERSIRVALTQFSVIIVLIIILYFPTANFLNNNDDNSANDNIVLEEVIDTIPSESVDSIDINNENIIIHEEEKVDISITEESSNDSSVTIENTLDNSNSSENIKNNNSQNTIVSEDKSQNNTTNDNSNIAPPIETPPIITPPEINNGETEDNNKEDDTTIDNSNNVEVELAAYLKRLGCNGCERGCMLDNPFCMVGIEKASKAKDKFMQFHSTNTIDFKFFI